MRRAYFDLTGCRLAQDVENFLKDTSPDAYEKLVDRLLASPQYGEHWARHWLDVADIRIPPATRRQRSGSSVEYRDYTINAFNKNKRSTGFNGAIRAIKWPLPRESSDARTDRAMTATGFCRTTADITDNQTIYEVDKYFDAQQKAVETSFSAVTGLTMQCARCHTISLIRFSRTTTSSPAIYQPVFDPENWLRRI